VNIQFIDPTLVSGWDEDILRFPETSFFHSASWAKVLKESYGYDPEYLTLMDSGRLTAVLPLMEVSSFITGKRGVSLPFTDYCEVLTVHKESSNVVFEKLKQQGGKRGWKYIELRGGTDYLGDVPPYTFFYRHELDLSIGADKILRNLRDSTRRNIKKSEKTGVEVRFEGTLDALYEFYRLNCMTRREHGLPPQPFRFFASIHEHIISRDRGRVALALHDGKVIAGCVYFHFGRSALYKYGASDRRFQHLRSNNLIMWEAIKRYAGEGYGQFCFGRTEPENEGLRQFKTGWSATERIINYYRYDLRKNTFMPAGERISSAANKLFSNVPIPIARAIGAVLYRHVG